MSKKVFTIVSIICILLILIVTFVPFKQNPSSTTRVVVDHFNHKYAFPSCYDYEEASNYIDEVTLKDAQDLKYPPMNECTKKKAQPQYKSMLKRLLESTEI
ncbi:MULTISPECIES: hypothetical protein [Mammaliicoccus]|uniref:Uncharacterized protein n=1 Tax=Mammaliicoccus vitulinus TaxID=71237 RepID=A0A2T4PU17_9STAP|nr:MULTISPECIES: hypothetical protein [Mammaliicoccus]MEB7658212.1 hypothetical protein [Mammaliicoccus vitulinus]PTI29913.1 hypothetical protein BU072_05570 [Mammaliicoccus vitulinus]PTI36684.1 hypothetical protein BU074_08925 [Mammaliicoccus vitulinus]PTI89733.1 hypothetical protein BU071_05480 [Mammaliicoccus vitulinus]QQT14415.1 hypothetical protein I6J10_07355 [Mammaliicoccus vitulinus]